MLDLDGARVKLLYQIISRVKILFWKFFGAEKSIPQTISIQSFSFDEKIIYFTAILTPVWWLLGIQPLFYPAIGLLLLLKNFSFKKAIRKPLPVAAWAWFVMFLVMLVTVLQGLVESGAGVTTFLSSMVTVYKSYLMIFAFIALPFWGKVRSQVIVRAVTWMSFGFLINLLIQIVLLAAGVNDAVFTPPLAKILPGDVKSLMVTSAKFSSFFGVSLPRSTLHTVDPPILGAVAFLTFMISLTESKPQMRRWGIVGSLSALIISFSRSAWVGTALGLLFLTLFRSRLLRIWNFVGLSIACLIGAVSERTPAELLASPAEIFNQARASSSDTRGIVVQATIDAWLEKFWLGWGIIRGEVQIYEGVYISLGSFSTYSAVLYLHGIIGFIVFLTSLLTTFWSFLQPAFRGVLSAQIALASLLILYILIQATPLSWMAIYLWFYFLWLGAVMHECVAA